MKAFCLFLLTIGCTALLYAEVPASPRAAQQQTPSRGASEVGAEQRHVVLPRDGGHQKQKSTVAQKQSRGVAVKKTGTYSTARPGPSMKPSGTRIQPSSGGAMGPVLPNAGRTASAKSSPNPYIAGSSRTSSVRMGGRSLPTLPSLTHRGPYTAVLGGGTNTRTATAGAITGTSMNRKP